MHVRVPSWQTPVPLTPQGCVSPLTHEQPSKGAPLQLESSFRDEQESVLAGATAPTHDPNRPSMQVLVPI